MKLLGLLACFLAAAVVDFIFFFAFGLTEIGLILACALPLAVCFYLVARIQSLETVIKEKDAALRAERETAEKHLLAKMQTLVMDMQENAEREN